MILPIGLRPLAETELDEAKQWYDRQRLGLGKELVLEVQRMLGEIARYPNRFPVAGRGLRQASLSVFPYSIFYRLRIDRIIVVAVFHNARDPADWQSRS